jgi:MFS family permease
MISDDNTSTTKKSGGIFYGWIIVATCFFVATITYGAGYSFGVFLIPLRESFGWTSAAISGAYSLCMFLYAGFGIFAGWGVDKYGPKMTTMIGGLLLGLGLLLTSQVNTLWQLYMTYGLIGIGMSSGYTPLLTTVSRWFTHRRGLALGIMITGVGVGPLIVAPLSSYFVSTYGWRLSYLVIGCFAILIIAAAWLLKKSPDETEISSDNAAYNANTPASKIKASNVGSEFSVFSLKKALSTKAFWLLSGILMMVGTGLQMVLAHVVAYGEGKGISPITAATVLSTISGASIAGRIIMGMISDWVGRRNALAICVFTEGIMIFWLMGTSSTWMLFVFGAIFGFFYGGHTPQFPALTAEILGLGHMGVILGAISIFWGAGAALGPVLAGYIFDITGSYSSAFVVGGVAMLLATTITLLLKMPEKKKARLSSR